MQAEDLPVDECSEWQVIEQVSEVFPHVGVAVLTETLVIEPVNLGDLT